MIRVLIVDDEPPARQNLRVLLGRVPDVEILAECGSGPRAVKGIEELKPDLVFLDIQMPGMDGFQVVERVGPESMPITVFVTAYDHYALRAFEVRALDYLLKPFDDARFEAALRRARELMRARDAGEFGRHLLDLVEDRRAHAAPRSHPPLRHVTAHQADAVIVLNVNDVHHFEADGDYVRAHYKGGSRLTTDTMKFLEASLDPHRFVRIHRSHIVNVDRIRALEPHFHGDWVVVLEGGTKLRLSRSRRAALERALGRGLRP